MLRRNESSENGPREIVFEADEDLYQAPSMRVLLLCGS
jgi:hypothetical protein